MLNKRLRSHTRRRLWQIALVAVMLAGAGAVIFLNFRREQKLIQMQEYRALMMERITQNPRFDKVTIQINTSDGFTYIGGTVATEQDLNALVQVISKMPPPRRTRWKIDTAVGN